MVSSTYLSPGAHAAAVSGMHPWLRMLSSLWGMLSPKSVRLEVDLAKEPERLASLVKPICTQMLKDLNYPGVPQLNGEAIDALLRYMYKRAVEIGVPLDTPMSAKAFRLGYSLGLARPPSLPYCFILQPRFPP